MVTLLLERGADASLKDDEGSTAKDWAEQRGQDAVADLLSDPSVAADSAGSAEAQGRQDAAGMPARAGTETPAQVASQQRD